MTFGHNLIGGEWLSGTAAPNINPSDTRDIVGGTPATWCTP